MKRGDNVCVIYVCVCVCLKRGQRHTDAQVDASCYRILSKKSFQHKSTERGSLLIKVEANIGGGGKKTKPR